MRAQNTHTVTESTDYRNHSFTRISVHIVTTHWHGSQPRVINRT